MMVSIKGAITKPLPQRRAHRKMEGKQERRNRDFLKEGLSSDDAFRILLKDRVFVDYFNTFLSLPIFAKRLFYRFDTKSFQVDGPTGPKRHHYSQDDVLTFARKERSPLFLKTDICNEYRLCKLILKKLYETNENEKYSLDLDRELGSALSMQRLKAFLHESAGENILSFWVAAERYRHQTVPECLRFALREIQDRYIRQGSWLELQESIKIEFHSALKRLFDDSPENLNKSELLIPCQEMAFDSLVFYWLPKYLAHRSHKRQMVKKKWISTLQTLDKSTLQQKNIVDKMKSYVAFPDKVMEDSSSTSSKQKDQGSSSECSTEAAEKEIQKFFQETENDLELSSDDNILVQRGSNTPNTFIGFEDDESETESVNEVISRASISPVRFPHLKGNSSLVLETHRTRYSTLSRDSPNTRPDGTKSNLMENGNQLAVLCSKFRDIALSRAIALSNCIRGNSKLDFEANLAFPSGFYQNLMPAEKDGLEYLWATLAADQLAGQPFCDYLRLMNHEQAFANLRFWVSAQQFLSSLLQMDTLMRRRQAQALIHIYMLKDSPRKTSLKHETQSTLLELLPMDLGYNALNTACWECAHALLPFWHEFLDLDEEKFAGSVNYRISSTHVSPGRRRGALKNEMEEVKVQRLSREKIPVKHMWNALQLAISISVPRNAKPLLEGYEDVDENEDQTEGSLHDRQLRVLNSQAAKALEDYRKCNPYQSSMAYYFYQQNLLLNNMSAKPMNGDRVTTITKEVSYKQNENRVKQPRPKSFQEVLHDPVQFEAFKKFLNKHESEMPILFWQAVESMRTNTREAKQRQLRANGILRRFFGPSTNFGQSLDCHADIVKELPKMDKVTPAMLVSAQTCVARSLEEKWYPQYLATFPEEEQLEGITKLPRLTHIDQPEFQFGREMKQSSRDIWKLFCRNVISFVRGISDHRVLRHFQNFLRCEHKMNVKKSKEAGEEDTQRVIISNKLVNTEKLLNDLRFWIEVDRYKDFADAVNLCAKLGNYTKEDELIVTRKAKAIVSCFVDSQVPPRVQINIPSDIAESIQSHVKNDIIERGLFHDAAFSVFSVLLYYWKKFCYYRVLPKAKLPECPSTARTTRSVQIERRKKSIESNRVRRVSIQPDDEYSKIMFSLEKGIRIAIVPIEEEIEQEHRKLPKINPFKLTKLARI